MKAKYPLLVSTIALGLVLGGFAAAQDRGSRPEMGERMAARLAEVLELDESEANALAEKMRDHRESMRPAAEALREAQRILDEQVGSETFDEAAIRDRAAAVAELQAEMAVARALHSQDLREMLSPEQYGQLQKMHQRRARASGGRGGGPQHHRGPGPHGR